MNKIRVGKIVNTQGLKGHVRVYPDTDDIRNFEDFEEIFIEGEKNPFQITEVRYKKNLVILKFKGLNHINEIEKYKGKIIYREKTELDEGVYYIEDLIGSKVIDEKHGVIGTLSDVIKNPAHDIYEVKTKGENILIPVVDEFIKEINLDKKEIRVELIEGFIDEV